VGVVTADQIRAALMALPDHEIVVAFSSLPRPLRNRVLKALHAELDRLAVEQ
jgi:hypothetical protein